MPAFCKLLEHLDRAGWDIEVVFVSRDAGSPAHTDRQFRWAELPNVGVRVLPLGRRFPFRLGWVPAELSLSFRILLLLVRSRADVAYFDRANINLAAAAKAIGMRVIVRLFGVADLPAFLATRRWGMFPRLRSWTFRARFDYVICSRDGSAGEAFMRKHLHPNVPRELLYNGVAVLREERDLLVDAGSSLREQYGLSETTLILLSTGRIEADRNLMSLLEVVAGLSATTEVFTIIVGEGDQLDSLKQAASRLGLENQVLFTGRIEHAQVFRVLQQADVYVSLCVYRSLGNDVLEAMRACKCIVAFDTCRVTGRDAEFQDPELRASVRLVDRECIQESLRDELIYLLNNREQIGSLGQRARDWAAKSVWTWDERLDYEERIIHGVIESRMPIRRAFTL